MNRFWNSRWYDNKWFLRIASLVFAVFLYGMVQASNPVINTTNLQQSASIDTTETISNVPVQLGKHDDDIFVSQLQESVTVTLIGPKNIVTQLASGNLVVQTEDLTGIETGQQTLRLEIPDLPEGVRAQISPSRVVVQVARRKTVTQPVEYDIEEGAIASGMEVEGVTLNPTEVELTGNEENINKVARAYIRISNETAHSQSFSGKYTLLIVDQDNKPLDVNASVSEIDARVELVSQRRRTLSLVVNATGEANGYRYQYQLVDGNQVTVQGPAATVDALRNIKVNVDVSSLTASTTVSGQLDLPDGVTATPAGPVNVAVTVTPLAETSENGTSSTSNVPSTSQPEESSTINQNGGATPPQDRTADEEPTNANSQAVE